MTYSSTVRWPALGLILALAACQGERQPEPATAADAAGVPAAVDGAVPTDAAMTGTSDASMAGTTVPGTVADPAAPGGMQAAPAAAVPTTPARSWPASVRVVGDGYPTAGAPCRRLGETPATQRYLDDSTMLVGCLAPTDAARLGGRIVGGVDGITVVAVPKQPAPAASASGRPIVTAGNRPAYCRGEAAGMYSVRPAYVKTQAPVNSSSGTTIDGTADQGDNGVKAFRCRFDRDGRFIDVMAMTSDGE